MAIANLIIFLVSLALLIAAGSILVKSLAKIAAAIKLSEYTIGFILLAFATSLPELFVGISSALNQVPGIILGTIIGSNIANLTIIIGIPILMARGIKIHSKRTKNDALWMIALSILPLVLMIIGDSISRIDGIILLLAFGIYIYKIIKEGKRFSKEIKSNMTKKAVFVYTLLFVVSIFLLHQSSNLVVEYAEKIAFNMSLPPIMIGLFLIAIGTSLPELVSGITAVLSNYDEMSVGNIIGSVISNSTLVIGVSAVIYPITASLLPFIISATFFFAVSVVFTAFVEEGDDMSWMEGLALVSLYIFFLIVEMYTGGKI